MADAEYKAAGFGPLVHAIAIFAAVLASLALSGVCARAQSAGIGSSRLPDGMFADAENGFAPLDGRLRVSVTARRIIFNNLQEPSSFNPAAAYVPQTSGWERYWSENELYATVAYDLVSTGHFLMRPGLHLGVAAGTFTARSEQAAFSETWELETAFLWGPSLYAEARLHENDGPFAAFGLDYFMAEAGERKESIGSSRSSGSSPEDRDARFRWTRLEASLAAGWRFGPFIPRLGLRYRDFRLEKTLTHHVSPAGATGEGLALITALNSAPSRYSYRAATPVVPFAEVSFTPIPNVRLCGAAILSTDQDFSLEAVFRF